jgi:hypothetical protein
MVPCIPVPNQKGKIPIRLSERNLDNCPVVNNKGTKATRGSLKIKRRKVEKAPNLIFYLKSVIKVPSRRNWTICAQNTILPWITSHLDPRPVVSHQSTQISENHSQHEIRAENRKGYKSQRTYHVIRRSSSKSLYTFITTLLLVVALTRGPGNCPLIAITCNHILTNKRNIQ